ncbi:MAG: glutamyl-tRNA reductase, partial [Bacteroidetes bacterium]|nr:glutamyl-tRNA reductase [Bacteroidota bacterium]
MNLFSIGISHHTASVEVREKMWLSTEEMPRVLALLKDRYFNECMVVSTCNRTEVYGIPSDPTMTERDVISSLVEIKGAASDVHPDHFTAHRAGAAMHHLFKVSAGIDSMVIGDFQILNQVKEAF